MTARALREAVCAGTDQAVSPFAADARRLAAEAADDREKTAELFRDFVEPLSDSFERAACELYARAFSEMIAELLPKQEAAGILKRYAKVRGVRPFEGDESRIERVYVLSRVTLGADIAVTSVLMNAAQSAFPGARVTFVGNRKNAELWAGDARVEFLEAPYERSGTLRGRLAAAEPLRDLLNGRRSVVIDPDSRLTQLGLLPVCDDRNYYFFESRSFGGDSSLSVGELAAQWVYLVFGVPDALPYLALKVVDAPETNNAPTKGIALSLGVGENASKQLGPEFESGLVQHLAATGKPLLVDQGAGGEEASRVEAAIEAASNVATPVETFFGPFATFAAHIASSALTVSYDSSAQHAAAALGVPLVNIFAGFPNERFLERWRPAGPGPKSTVIVRDRSAALAETKRAVDDILSASGAVAIS